jgi:hypothetical protein
MLKVKSGTRSVGFDQPVMFTNAERWGLLHNRSVTYNNEVQCKQWEGEGRILAGMT